MFDESEKRGRSFEMLGNRTFPMDSGIAIALACALGVVFVADREKGPREPGSGRVTVTSQRLPEAPAAPALRLAVTPPQYDDMGKLLTKLGPGYAFTEIRLEDFEDVSKLVQYDVVFLTCGTVPESWVVANETGDLARPGTRRVRINEQIINRVKEALRAFVGRGGTLYASDWRLIQLFSSFPELFDGPDLKSGAVQTLSAEVVDPGLRDALESSRVDLKFDLPDWYPASIGGRDVTTYLRGTYRASSGSMIEAPLLVKVPFQQGNIIFTSFHNEKVNNEVETKLLKFLVFAAVMARESAQAQRTMISGGFKPQKQNLLSASPENPSSTQIYANTKRGRLRFVLSFGNQGAHLKLTVRGPDGGNFERDGTSTFSVDVADASPGNWTYTVTALKLPHQEFPFTLTVGND